MDDFRHVSHSRYIWDDIFPLHLHLNGYISYIHLYPLAPPNDHPLVVTMAAMASTV
jgi:hypothetical protein